MKDFYPTPSHLIAKMLQGLNLKNLSILEPSAGKGDIADHINRYFNTKADVIEIESELQATLKGKGYNLVFDDFLNFTTHKHYDYIIANFPFSEGEKHLAKALQMIENGGTLICLVNAETIRNPYTNLRQIIADRLQGATIEYLEDQFIDAERKTGVEVALIKMTVDSKPSTILLDNLKKSMQYKANEFEPNQIIDGDFVNALIARFNLECKIGINLIREYESLQPYIMSKLNDNQYNSPILELKVSGDYDNLINRYVSKLRHKYWALLLANPNFRGRYTSNVQDSLSKKLDDLSGYDFNLFNIKQLEADLNKNIMLGIEQAILKLFEDFSHKYHWSKE